MRIELEIKGGEEFAEMLEELDRKFASEIVNDVLTTALEPVLTAAKANAAALARPISSGLASEMSKQLEISKIKRSSLSKGHFGSTVRFKRDVKKFVHITKAGKRYYIPTAVEYGHAFPGRGGGKNAPKDVAARPFVRPAFDVNKEKVVASVEKQIDELIK